MWPLAVLTGFSYEKMYGRFAGQKNIGCNNDVTVRRGSTVLLYANRHIVLKYREIVDIFFLHSVGKRM